MTAQPTRSTLRLQAAADQVESSARVPIFTGNTGDVFVAPDGSPRRLPHLLAGWAADKGRATILYSPASGARQLTPPGRAQVAVRLPPVDCPTWQAVEELLRQVEVASQPVQLLIDYADLSLPPVPSGTVPELNQVIELIADFAIDPHPPEHGHRLALIARAGDPDGRLAPLPGFEVIDIPLPDFAERLCFIQRLSNPITGRRLHLDRGLTAERLAVLTGGLTLDDLYRSRNETDAGNPLGHAWVQQRKGSSLRRLAGDNLVVHPPGGGLTEVAGLPQLRVLLREVSVTGRPPRRLLLAGPPGVGKTLVVTCLADELGLPAVALGNFRSMWVGESERNIRRVLNIIQSLAPCVLHIDEIDQSVGQRSTGQSADGGTSERVLADLWTFLGDSTRSERVVVIATTNRPELLDSALFDRFTVVPILHPTPREAAQILSIAAAREDRVLDEATGLAAVARIDGLLTGRVLVDVLERAMTLADLDGTGKEIQQGHLDKAFADLLTALDQQEHEYLALRALQLTTFRSYLPWTAARALGEEPHLPAYLAPLLNVDGGLDAERLRLRLRHLAGHRASQ
jgi:transitional endoplasmic reticulum ATPase